MLTFAMKSLGDRLRELRDARDLSVRELSRRIGRSAATISDIELGRRYPSDEVLAELAKELGTTTQDLKAFDHRPQIDELRRRAEREPTMGFALRRIIDQGVTGDELLRFLENEKKKKP